MRRTRAGGWALGLLVACGLANATQAQEGSPRSALTVSGWAVQAEIAVSPEARAIGLMGRADLPENEGMLFVFQDGGHPCLWMKGTPLPLAAAFLDRRGVILSIVEMQAHSLDIHCSPATSGYALEMNAGWFSRRGIRPGAQLSGLDAVRR